MSELLPCPFCGEEPSHTERMTLTTYRVICYCDAMGPEVEQIDEGRRYEERGIKAANLAWNTRYSKYSLAPVSSTLDRLLDSRFDMAAEAEADLGTIEHEGEKLTVKIKVVRGE